MGTLTFPAKVPIAAGDMLSAKGNSLFVPTAQGKQMHAYQPRCMYKNSSSQCDLRGRTRSIGPVFLDRQSVTASPCCRWSGVDEHGLSARAFPPAREDRLPIEDEQALAIRRRNSRYLRRLIDYTSAVFREQGIDAAMAAAKNTTPSIFPPR